MSKTYATCSLTGSTVSTARWTISFIPSDGFTVHGIIPSPWFIAPAITTTVIPDPTTPTEDITGKNADAIPMVATTASASLEAKG